MLARLIRILRVWEQAVDRELRWRWFSLRTTWHQELIPHLRLLTHRHSKETETVKIEQGTIIEGTTLLSLITPRMLSVVEEHDPKLAAEVRRKHRPLTGVVQEAWYFTDEGQAMYEELHGILNDLAAPYGLYFGGHPCDPADVGFWAHEPDDEPIVDVDELSLQPGKHAGDCEFRVGGNTYPCTCGLDAGPDGRIYPPEKDPLLKGGRHGDV